MTRVSWWFWAGFALLLGSVGASFAGHEWVKQNLTPLGWTGVILLADGWLARRGASWLARYPGELVGAAIVSIPSWLLFELYNCPRFFLGEPPLWWHYHGLPPWPDRAFGYAWAFATITPAVLLLAQTFRPFFERWGQGKGGRVPQEVAWVFILVGAPMAILPLLWPSPYFAADVWLAWPVLMEGVNFLVGFPCLLRDFEAGDRTRFFALLAAGGVCGFIWESLNMLASARWVYTVPFAGKTKLFEMPILGYFGFLPFAVAVFDLWVFLRWLFPRPPEALAR